MIKIKLVMRIWSKICLLVINYQNAKLDTYQYQNPPQMLLLKRDGNADMAQVASKQQGEMQNIDHR